MREKQQIEIEGTNTELSNACDDLISARDVLIKRTKELKDDKDAAVVASERVASIMIKLGMDSCRHSGLTFKVKEAKEVKPKVIVKESI